MKSQNVFQQNLVTFPLPSLLVFFTLELLLCQSGCCLLTDSLVFSVCHWTLNQCRSIGVVGVSVDCCRTQPVQESCSDITLRLNWTNFFQIVYTIFSWKKSSHVNFSHKLWMSWSDFSLKPPRWALLIFYLSKCERISKIYWIMCPLQ